MGDTMTYQKLKACPRCGNGSLGIYSYENGWKHVECSRCNYLGPGKGTIAQAIKSHNERIATLKEPAAASLTD
jgi:ribosomal protein S27AE